MKKTFLLLLAMCLSACTQQDSSSSSTPSSKSTRQNIDKQEQYLFNFMGFSPCIKATREDILKIYQTNEASNLKTTIDSKFGITLIEGKIGKEAKVIDVVITLWDNSIMSIDVEKFYPKYISEMNVLYGKPVDELDELTASLLTINKLMYKNPSEHVSMSLRSVIYQGKKLPPSFRFDCISIEKEYQIHKAKVIGK